MKITNKNKNKKRILILTITGAIILTVAIIYLGAFRGSIFGWQPFSPQEPAINSDTQSSIDTSHGTKDDSINAPGKTTNQIPVNDSIVASIDELTQKDGYIKFTGSVNNVESGGTCSVLFTNPNDRPISRTVATSISDNKSVCGPIVIPETEFSFLGEWITVFRYYVNETQAVVEGKILIQ